MKFTVIIPTMWKDTFRLLSMLEKYEACPLISTVLIIDNDKDNAPEIAFEKVHVIKQHTNIFVNPAWNLGVQMAKTKSIILTNDDIIISDFDDLMKAVEKKIGPDMVIGVNKDCYINKQSKESLITISPAGSEMEYGFGVFMVMEKSSYHYIPEELKVWYGDRWEFKLSYAFLLSGVFIDTPMQSTSKTLNLRGVSLAEGDKFSKLLGVVMKKTTTIALVLRSGGDFHFRDVQLLAKYLHKYSDIPLRIICFTDTVSSSVKVEGFEFIPLPNKKWPGWWAKMNLFSPELKKYRPFLYFDLDTAIVNKFTHIIPNKSSRNLFITLSDFYRLEYLASGVMWIPYENVKITKIWEAWNKKAKYYIENENRGDQGVIQKIIGNSDKRWQNVINGITTFKPRKRKVNKFSTLQEIPYHVSIVCFHGKPRIFDAVHIEWVSKYVKGTYDSK